jgi:hypothetical protein
MNNRAIVRGLRVNKKLAGGNPTPMTHDATMNENKERPQSNSSVVEPLEANAFVSRRHVKRWWLSAGDRQPVVSSGPGFAAAAQTAWRCRTASLPAADFQSGPLPIWGSHLHQQP